jgi:hypothetical protein
VTDYANRRIVDENARRRLSSDPVDFVAIDDSDRRDRLRADRKQFDTLRDERTGDEKRPLFNFLVMFRRLLDLGVGKYRASKHARRQENCSGFRYGRLHKQKLHPESCSVQIIETMMMVPCPRKRERQ